MENVLVSACLLGVHCRYDGKCQNIPAFAERLPELMGKYNLIPVCPEVFGGMTTPRLPSEIVSGHSDEIVSGHSDEIVLGHSDSVVSGHSDAEKRLKNSAGEDVTDYFLQGAKEVAHLAKLYNCRYAILKKKSPSCGSGEVYDGTFSKTLVKGDGVTAAMLKSTGVTVFNEENCFLALI